jgi:hypothetical protein
MSIKLIIYQIVMKLLRALCSADQNKYKDIFFIKPLLFQKIGNETSRLKMNSIRLLLFFFLVFQINNTLAEIASTPWVGIDLKGFPCKGPRENYGPFDYTQQKSIFHGRLDIVEHAHFTPDVENLIGGVTGSIAGDLEYTLRAWPNHHRALLTLIRYQLKVNDKIATENQLKTPPECYFQRALNFSPKDGTTASLYGYYLRKIGHLEEAAKAYEKALKLDPGNTKIEYAYSLLLIDLKQYDNALVQAKKAYQHGKPPNGLKNKLIKLGVWK